MTVKNVVNQTFIEKSYWGDCYLFLLDVDAPKSYVPSVSVYMMLFSFLSRSKMFAPF